MQADDLVIYVQDPLLYGKLIIIEVTANGLLLCEQVHKDHEGAYGREVFDAQELEMAAVWDARDGAKA